MPYDFHSFAHYYCARCAERIVKGNVNFKEGVALCPECGLQQKIEELIYLRRSKEVILQKPPKGCEIVEDEGESRKIITISYHDSERVFLGLVFALFWNLATLLFITILMLAIIQQMVGPLPSWVPNPEIKGA